MDLETEDFDKEESKRRRIQMGEVKGLDRYNGDGVPRVPPKALPSGVKRKSSEQLTEHDHPLTNQRWRTAARHHSRKGARGQDGHG